MLRAALLTAATMLLGAGALWFEPWRLLTSSEIDEPLPVLAGRSQAAVPPATTPPPAASAAPSSATPEPGPSELAAGRFEDAEHATTGRARILALSDGSRFVRLEGLSTSDGPDLHLWLSEAPSGGAWGSYDDGAYVRHGELKATDGNQNYPVPAEADLGAMRSVVIWCDRFDVAFGTAPIAGP